MCNETKDSEITNNQLIENDDVLEFTIFCIENVAKELKIDGLSMYKILTSKGNVLKNYIIPCYAPLHTQGKEYIVNDIIEVMKKFEVTK